VILRRLSRSARRQDWFAVALELVVVVVGIFLGLQVTEWNERRELREGEFQYLARLAEDVSAMRTSIGAILERGEGRREATLRVFRALEVCDAGLAEPGDFRRTFAEYQVQPSADVVGRTDQEMVASGALASMSDRTLSAEIASVFSGLTSYQRFIAGVRVSLPGIDRILWRDLDLSYDEEGRPTLSNFDFGATCSNRELRTAVWEIHDLVWDWESVTRRTAEEIDDLGVRLDRYLLAHGAGATP